MLGPPVQIMYSRRGDMLFAVSRYQVYDYRHSHSVTVRGAAALLLGCHVDDVRRDVHRPFYYCRADKVTFMQ